MTQKRNPRAVAAAPGAESVPRASENDEVQPRSERDGAQGTYALPFPLRVFRATKPHPQDGHRARERAPRRPVESRQVEIAWPDYDPRQTAFRWER